jgi:hypothetical protein
MENKPENSLEEGTKMSLSQVREFLKEYEILRVKNEFLEKIVSLVIVSLGLITAMAWDGAIKDTFNLIFDGVNTLREKVIYALTITFIAVVVSVVLSRLVKKKKS